MSQTALAKAIGASQSTITKYENAERRLDVIQVARICRVLGIKFSSLAKEFD